MFKIKKPLFLICETPLHAGSGSDLGIVDLPIQRERHTNFPKIEASSLKGALREASETYVLESTSNKMVDLKELNKIFGYDEGALKGVSKEQMKNLFENEEKEFAGCIGFTDARLLLFPVKSLYGVFAWITCPRVIKRFINDLQLTGVSFDFNTEGVIEGRTPNGCESLYSKEKIIQLEEFIFNKIQVESNDGNISKFATWLSQKVFEGYGDYWQEKAAEDIVVLSDEDFRDFVTITTEVITRTKIDNERGTVESGALFSEEYLPAESVMYSLAMFADENFKNSAVKSDAVHKKFEGYLNGNNNIVQIGGNATLGKGIVKTKLINA